MKVFVYSIAIAVVFVLLSVVFRIIAGHNSVDEEKEYKFKLLSWIFFYIAMGIVIGLGSVFVMLNHQGSLN